ncbi:DoxX family membrane protein [Geothrix campi]|uniref:DoxX family membrane protein n=1 Tax=Geothrix campi TaxID=2966450 RepID=UPI002147E514|nr:DoxX family membrane protein [Geothrix sp. SG10]
MDKQLNSSWWALRIGLGAVPFLAGLDKFFNLLAKWELYLNPLALRLIPVAPATFMRAVGVIEMIVGLAILTRWTRLGAYVAAVWLVGIALNLITMGAFLDVAVRDLLLAVAAFTLARLTEVRQPEAGASFGG